MIQVEWEGLTLESDGSHPLLDAADATLRLAHAGRSRWARAREQGWLEGRPAYLLLPEPDTPPAPGPEDWRWLRERPWMVGAPAPLPESAARLAETLHRNGVDERTAGATALMIATAGATARRHPIEWPYGVIEAAPDLYSPRMGALSANPLDGFDSMLADPRWSGGLGGHRTALAACDLARMGAWHDPALPDRAWDAMERAGMRPWFDDPGF